MKKTLYNCYTDNYAAYCCRHHCNLTEKQLRGKECLKKNCWHLKKNENHEYWKQRERVKQRRIERKERLNGNTNRDIM